MLFVCKASFEFKKHLIKILTDKFNISFKVVTKSAKIGDFFQLKSSVPFPLLSDVVYYFECLSDANTSYIGKTDRHLITRVKEHIDVEAEKKTAIASHIVTCPNCQQVDISNFRILCKTDKFNLGHREAILMRRYQPSLNKQLFQNGASCTMQIF